MTLDLAPAFNRAHSMVSGLIAAIPGIVVALVVFGGFVLLAAVVKGVVARLTEARFHAHRNAGMAVGRLAQGLVLFVGLLVALSVALPTFKPGDVVQVLGISSVAIGFAFRDILQNFLAGILLLVTQPFRIGDQIVAGTHEGTVEDVQARATFIRTYDGRRVVIPNAALFTDTVVVNTAFERRRLEYDLGIGYGDDVELARSVMLNTVRQILFHDQTEESDGDRRRQREGWPAGKADVPAPRTIADAIAQTSQSMRHQGDRE